MVSNVRDRNIDSSRREDSRKGQVDRCEVINVRPHVAPYPDDKDFNTVDVQLIDRPRINGKPLHIKYVKLNSLQRYHGRFQGEPWNARIGDMIYVYWLAEREALVLGTCTSVEQEPVCRSQADAHHQEYVFKLSPWEEPKQNDDHNYVEFPDPKHPECYKWWPKTRDSLWIFDCLEGHNTPSCCGQACNSLDDHQSSTCFKNFSDISPTTIDLPRRFKFLHHCGSFWYYDEDGTIHIAGKVSGSLKNQQIFYPSGKILLENVVDSCSAILDDDGDIKLNPAAKVIVDGDMVITGTCTHNACSCDNAAAASGCDVAVALEDNIIKIVDKEGTVIEEGVLGVDDTACLQAGIDACPQNGKMFICPGTFTLEADKLFYLNGSGPETADNPFYYCLGVMDGKNIALEGSGVGSTILKMAAHQHYEGHHAVMILNRAHWWGDGATMFVVSDMTIDGNRDEQDEWYHDGPGLFLTGSLASNFRFQRLWLKDSFGYGIYCGNNGSGPINGLVINDIRATNCYKTAIMTDTVCGLLVNNCIIEDSDCGLQCVGNQPDYLTRPRDAIVISDVICRRAGITLWTVNDVTMNGVYMDCTGAPLQHGLLIHSAIRVMVSASKFINNTNYKYSTFIDANTYMEDGPCEVFLNNCDFEGSYAFRILGEAVCHVHNGRIQGYRTCVYMIGEYMSPVACRLNLHGVDVLALQPIGEDPEPTLLVDIAEGGDVLFDRCIASKAGYFQVAAGGKYFARDCIGAGLEGYNSRWRKEEGTFNPTPASTSTITTLIDRTGAISIGTPVRYEIAGVIYYGLVMNITTTTITIAGPPLSDDIDDLYFGVSEMVGQADYVIPGSFAAAAEDELIKTFQKSHSIWRGKPAYLVQIGHIVQALDSTDQPEVTASINSGVVGTDNTNTGLPVALVVQSTGVGINPSNYRIEYGDVIELETTAGGTGDASDLTVFLTFVSESQMLIKRHFVPVPANGPPEITNFQASLASPQVAGTSITFTATATDTESDPLEYKFLLDSAAQTGFTSSNSWAWETDAGDVGDHSVGVLVRDNNHNPEGDDSASINFSIEAAPQFEYQAVYPTGYSDETYVKTTNRWFELEGFRAVDPALSLSGGRYLNSWLTENGHTGSQRFHVEFAAAQVIKRIRYCNSHHDGYETNVGVKDFIVQGSNSATAFANLVYGDDTDWAAIATDVSTMVQHTEGYDGAIWNVIELTNDTAYKYYAVKCVNNHGNASYIGLRRVEFQILVEV